jgi:NADH:ubiquinone oxidoreductase subunit 6 (subunit J)
MSEFPAAEAIASAIFLGCAAVVVCGALLAALSTRVIRSVCGLAVTCIGLSGMYYFLNSPFLAMMEVLIYLGAVCVNVAFAVMLTEPDEPPRARGGKVLLWTAFMVVVCAAVFWALTRLALGSTWESAEPRVNDGSVRAIGIALLTTHSLAFELISLVLLVAIIGALAVARPGRTRRA